ncbi:MAG: Tuberous sclerosis 2-like protein [Peltula sp. TS41687]|nr:MAG: Tuberous sclerosis 2-like protein [Peltula sp. TS41687]
MLTANFKHLDATPLERRRIFESISAPVNPQDFNRQLLALIDLTNHGKDVATFESDLVPLVTRWLEYWFQAAGAARKKEKERDLKEKEKGTKVHGVLREETNLTAIYAYVNSLVRFSSSAFREQDMSSLLSQLLRICKRTTVSSDIKSSIDIFNALVTYGEISRVMLEPCLDVLCGAYGTLKDLADPIWNTMCNLGKSHTAQNMATALLDIVKSPSMHVDRNTNTIRGAVMLVTRIMIADGEEGLVKVSFSAAMGAFQMSLATNSSRLELEVVGAVVKLVEDDGYSKALLQEDDWSILLDILAQCSRKVNGAIKAPSKGSKDKEKENIARLSASLTHVIHHLESLCLEGNFDQKQSVIDFFKAIHSHLPDTCAELLVQHYAEEHLCYPSNPDWLTEAKWLIQAFFLDPIRPASIRLLVLQAIKDIYQIVAVDSSSTDILELVMPVYCIMPKETDDGVLEGLRDFAVDIASHRNESISDAIIASLHTCLATGRRASTKSSDHAALSPPTKSKPTQRHSPAASVAIRGLVTIFIRALNCHAFKASKIFDLLLEVAQCRDYDLTARINAFRALFRLRSDSANALFLTTDPESEAMASCLGRTVASGDLQRMVQEPNHNRQAREENPGSAQSSRSSSTGGPLSFITNLTRRATNPVATSYFHSVSHWVYPNKYALPETPPSTPSHVVFCHPKAVGDTDADTADQKKLVLKVKVWLEAVISILQQEDDWDLYSYVIVHLGAQLSNHALFMDAVPQIQMLRSVFCEQMRINSFREPPSWAGLKRPDVMICLFHVLTILLTYHEHFSKNEQDEIVRTFMMGIASGERTAKHAIHGLSICCHELPLSVSKSLNAILQKMSQIITQSQVAVHILEFLACLARMPDLYVNFREEDFWVVFGICFRYLQYVRDQRQRASIVSDSQTRMKRESGPSTETASLSVSGNDLPQYVYALAYHVITFWFMSLKMADRAKYISWITKNLITTDSMGKEVIDEQSQVTIDMMQRITYCDHDETLPDPHFALPADGPVIKKSWLVGMSILTVETAVRSGVSQLTKRQPSATTYATYRSKVAPRPLHQVALPSSPITSSAEDDLRVDVLPNHILLQLTSSPWRTPESMRPIPLPDDETTRRAINMFDRNSTVDGHKVGIIYISEGQTNEAEILSNVIGNEDFTSFLGQIGTLTRLKDATFNTQGLDRETNMDGEFTICWRDRVTEMIFHIPTMMPTDKERDPQCINKKRHTGNDFVNIIFNNSGLAFRFDTFPSEFNYVNIVITPEARASPLGGHTQDETDRPEKRFYKLQVMSKPGFPELSPAAETKVVSGKSLPGFVRLIALNASVFSLVWANRETGELVSSWRNRLREIARLRGKHSQAQQQQINSAAAAVAVAQPSHRESLNLNFRRTSGPMFFGEGIASHRSSLLSPATTAMETDVGGGEIERESLVDG